MRWLIPTLLACANVCAADWAYVPNEKSATISVIDLKTDGVLHDWKVGGRPRGIALDVARNRLIVSDAAKDGLVVLDAATGRELARVDLGKSPEGVSLSRDGRWIAAAVEEANAVALVDAASLAVVAQVATEGKNPEHAVFSVDGRWLYVSA